MLLKFLPILITAASFLLAAVLHWYYKTSFLLPSFLAATASSIVAFLSFRFLPIGILASKTKEQGVPWDAIGFAFSSGFILALLVGYLMKYAPKLFDK